ncbi:FkbM family methyltransferase [uncultured Winogradskyella sp.]|uniref:FkbM family methyltransferase n=1 Tax=uncultured Winogradskyella sp. TaxID=395353 RepID=UPI00262EE7EF|nr:FkbM family methyltransferase [uncultured Winogradskyella sp.]
MQNFYKIIYNSYLNFILRNLNRSVHTLLPKKIKLPPSGILKLKTDSGIIKLATNQTSYLTQLLFWNGYKNFEYSNIFEKLSKKTNTFLDIGSNIGYYALLGVVSNPNMRVYAFEPAHGPKFYLNKNIILNNLSHNITAVDLALSDTNGAIDFYEVESFKYKYLKYNLAGEGNAGTKKTSRNFVKNELEAKTLDDFVKQQNIPSIDLMKIDTEGTEIDILNSGLNTIRKYQPIVICETLFSTIENELEDYFKNLDYVFYNYTNNGLTRVETIKRTKDNGVRNCFFVPKNKINLIEEFVV